MTEEEKTHAFREVLSTICNRKDFTKNLQNVHTPFSLCNEMIMDWNVLLHCLEKTYLTFNLEFVEVLCYDKRIEKGKVTFITDCPEKAKIIKEYSRYFGVNVILTNYLLWENNDMKFDVIVGNPPYNPQEREDKGRGKSELPCGINL